MSECTKSKTWQEAQLKSREYSRRSKEARILEYNKSPTLCKSCGISFSYENRKKSFCNHSCAATYNNVGINRHEPLELVEKLCNKCKSVVYVKHMNKIPMCDSCKKYTHDYKLKKALGLYEIGIKTCILCHAILSNKSSIYCSIKCSATHRRQLYFDNYVKNQDNAKYVSANVRRMLIEQNDNKCSICGWGETNPYSNTIPLIIDHIDGHPENNKLSNLRVICPNCDSLTPTYKGLNKGNGRKARALHYHISNNLCNNVNNVPI